jgi:ubiquinone/menaquinone biosynthesis C-methylase UbiE
MNFQRIYEYRFQHADESKKQIVWKAISEWLYAGHLNKPQAVLDPAGGLCEFINNVPAKERWAIDIEKEFISKYAHKDVHIVIGNNLEVEIPENHFDAIFISNFLEHLMSQEEVATLLGRMYKALKKGGRIVVMGPNFKYCYKEYFDFADHTVILSELGVAEHLYGAGFTIKKIIPRFLPLSFRSGGWLPVTAFTVGTYLKTPLAWRFMGKQFLLVAEK